jgi:acetoacetyl-CoA synthetase
MPDSKPIIREARAEDLPAIASYLAPRLGGPGGEQRFRRFWEYDWLADKPNLGFLIDDGGKVGGFVGAIYARRRVREREQLFCNLSSWHVEEKFRNLSLALVGRLLTQRDCTFTTFSPSARVIEVLKFFKFQVLDPEKMVFAPVSGLIGLLRRPRARIFWGKDLPGRLTESERRIFEDHRSYRCGQFVIEQGGDRCYFVTVRRGHGARAFADVLYASNPDLLADSIGCTHVPIGLTHRTVLTGIDRRLLRSRPAGAYGYRGLRPLMFRSDTVGAHDIDTLYSELIPMYG